METFEVDTLTFGLMKIAFLFGFVSWPLSKFVEWVIRFFWKAFETISPNAAIGYQLAGLVVTSFMTDFYHMDTLLPTAFAYCLGALAWCVVALVVTGGLSILTTVVEKIRSRNS